MTRFWKVLAGFTNEERQKWVLFGWGRKRLPSPGKPWSHKHKLIRRGGDESLPMAHSCFFRIDMPLISTETMLRNKMLLCIQHGLKGISAY